MTTAAASRTAVPELAADVLALIARVRALEDVAETVLAHADVYTPEPVLAAAHKALGRQP